MVSNTAHLVFQNFKEGMPWLQPSVKVRQELTLLF